MQLGAVRQVRAQDLHRGLVGHFGQLTRRAGGMDRIIGVAPPRLAIGAIASSSNAHLPTQPALPGHMARERRLADAGAASTEPMPRTTPRSGFSLTAGGAPPAFS
jgi:hypothetical protein